MEKLGLGDLKVLVESDNAQTVFSVQAAEAAPANKDPHSYAPPLAGWFHMTTEWQCATDTRISFRQ